MLITLLYVLYFILVETDSVVVHATHLAVIRRVSALQCDLTEVSHFTQLYSYLRLLCRQ
jgi:hypothetical protein